MELYGGFLFYIHFLIGVGFLATTQHTFLQVVQLIELLNNVLEQKEKIENNKEKGVYEDENGKRMIMKIFVLKLFWSKREFILWDQFSKLEDNCQLSKAISGTSI